MTEKAARPKILGGLTVRVSTGCGPLYIQMNWCKGELFEVFATMGKAGGCVISHLEALTRAVTLGLRCGIPLNEFVRQLTGIGCPTPQSWPKEEAVASCSDALGKTLDKYGSLPIGRVVDLLLETNVPTVGVGESEMVAINARVEKLAAERDALGL